MKETGIVRRVDELGRVVIPKEMRKTLHIKEGDPLEIYTEKNLLIFEKYSPLSTVADIGKTVCNGIKETLELDCILTDTDEVLFVSGGKAKEIYGKKISDEIQKILKERKSVVIRRADGGLPVPVYRQEEVKAENQIIVPIVLNGDCLGCLIVFNCNADNKLELSHLSTVRMGASIIAKQFD